MRRDGRIRPSAESSFGEWGRAYLHCRLLRFLSKGCASQTGDFLSAKSGAARRLSVYGYGEWVLGPPQAGQNVHVITDRPLYPGEMAAAGALAFEEIDERRACLRDRGRRGVGTGARAPSCGAGAVVVADALWHRADPKGIVLLDGDAISSGGAPSWLSKVLVGPWFTSIFRIATSSDWIFRRGLADAYPNHPSFTREFLEEWERPFKVRGSLDAFRAMLRYGIQGFQLTQLHSVRTPALVLWGVGAALFLGWHAVSHRQARRDQLHRHHERQQRDGEASGLAIMKTVGVTPAGNAWSRRATPRASSWYRTRRSR